MGAPWALAGTRLTRGTSTAIALAAGILCTGCGAGTAGIFSLFGSGGGSSSNQATAIGDLLVDPAPGNGRVGPIVFSFRLSDAESDPALARVQVVPPGGGAPFAAALVGAPSEETLASSPAGAVYMREWDYAAQLSTGAGYASGYRLRVEAGTADATSVEFAVGNDPPSVSAPSAPSGEITGLARIEFVVADSASEAVTIAVEYEDLDEPSGWRPATSAGPPPTRILAEASGVRVVFFWDVPSDEGGRELHVRVRLVPSDDWSQGAPATLDLVLDNNVAPLALLSGSAFFADPDARRGIPLPLRIVDQESDAVQVVVQWRTPFQSFPSLPSSPAELQAILDDPREARLRQIATELPRHYRGRIAATGSAAVLRLPELADEASPLLAHTLVGRELELLRPSRVPTPASPYWSGNPLTLPVALLPTSRGVLVLEPFQGGWRLREIDAASGVVLADVASFAARTPDALAPAFASERDVLVADEAGGLWRLARVDLSSGGVTTLYQSAASLALAPVRGLVALSENIVLVTAGSALIRIDTSVSGAPTEQAVFTDLQGPWGLAHDPRLGSRVFVAERDWINPSSSTVEGRVLRVDLASRERVPLTVTGTTFRRPSALALERAGARVLALTDANPADGTLELRAVDLGGGDRGQGFQITAGLPADATGLVTGPYGLRMLAWPAAREIAAGGGVQERGRIAAFDPMMLAVTMEAPFTPAPTAAQPWQIRDVVGDVPTSAGGTDEVFLWDSEDLAEGGEVVLQAVPYDDERGTSTDTGVPRAVRNGIEVTPLTFGGALATDGVSGLHLADLNLDGQLDLVTANQGSDRIAVFYQTSPGTFPAAPDLNLAGVPALAPLTDPAAVRVLDVDHDDDLDIVSVNRGSNNFTIFRQTSGSFAALTPFLALGLSQPSDLEFGDLNGDGGLDLVIADTGNDRVKLYYQALSGLYATTPSATVGNASTLDPVALGVGDLDSDGDLDIVSADTGSNELSVFLAGAAGSFAAAPSFQLGGPGITSLPSDLVVADFDTDGRFDIASADRGGNQLSVFLQSAAGFASTPTHVLDHADGPGQPLRLAAADMNGDGALDLISLNDAKDLTVFHFDAALHAYGSRPVVLGAQSGMLAPSCLDVADVDGNGFADIAAGDSVADVVKLYFHDDGTVFGSEPSLVLGSQADTPGTEAVAVADLDSDGDLDLASANAGDGTISVYKQLGPAVIGGAPAQRISSAASTPGVRTLAAVDLSGDGRIDLVAGSPGVLALFMQGTNGSFSGAPDRILGGALANVAHVIAADLDGDGDCDLACAEETGDAVVLFLQRSSGLFDTAPTRRLGDSASCNGPVQLAAADLDRDGDLDVATANRAGNDVSLFRATAAGLEALPSGKLGGGGQTDSPRALVIEDLDMDGDMDLALACAGENGIALFLQGAAGFATAPSALLTHALVSVPTTLAVADPDRDLDFDLVSGNEGGPNLVLYRQTGPGRFAVSPPAIGGLGSVDSPRTLLALDLDGDDETDLVCAHPALDRLSVFFGSH